MMKSAVSASLYAANTRSMAITPIANWRVVMGPMILSSTSMNWGTTNCGTLFQFTGYIRDGEKLVFGHLFRVD